MTAKPLKIIRRVAEAPKPAVAAPGVPAAKKKKAPLKLVTSASIKVKKSIEGILSGKTAKDAMIDAGYSENTAKNPGNNLFNTKVGQEELEPVVKQLLEHRDEILIQMRAAVGEADYGELARGLNVVIKNIQLLTGKPTGKVGFVLDQETQDAIKAVIGLNAG